ncbi:MAG: sigma-54 dependent transcriptional regulator [Pelagibacteraceae bacterium]|jgi:two-component system nitrogen regulation response regulator NtrX|nr:sigma-54-dependent Fis family transcriptional regulator [Candidatus Pelagibacter sp.]MDP6709822.1 sigma-54 dependent transcriptional regulator [Pelagibacteraceae bacterium]|tara:strand:- start:2236 stop:3600 length:1365 start_codon:yes stop_codon:yes gene_type:complete
MTNEILVIDDNSDIRMLISSILNDNGFSVREAANFDQAILEINKKLPNVAVIDVKLDKGDNDGIELLNHIKKIDNDLPVIMISGHANVQMAVDSLKLGAFEFMQKPFSTERLLNFVNRAIENIDLKKAKSILESKLFHSYEVIGQSQAMEKVRDLIAKLGSAGSRVFISGPAGSGKELVARQIHKKSSRSTKSFIVVSGALLDPEKYELQLFGSENKDGTINYGFFEQAKDGTLLIDEISEIPLETQAKILRVLIEQKFKRINGSKEINVNVRIISTSSKDIREEVDKGNFREDLYHRLNVVPIFLPALKDRTEDIPLLLNYFSKKISELNGISETKINSDYDLFYKYGWPGNVRELRNLVERISILAVNEKQININSLVKDALSQKNIKDASESFENVLSYPLKVARERFEKDYLTSQLKKYKGNISKTAEFIGMERSALHRKLKTLGIKDIN